MSEEITALRRWWARLANNERAAKERQACEHRFDTSDRTVTLDGRRARVAVRTCSRCGEDRTVTHWLDAEPAPQPPVSVTFTRREFDALLRWLPTQGAPDRFDLIDARTRMERADRPLKVVS